MCVSLDWRDMNCYQNMMEYSVKRDSTNIIWNIKTLKLQFSRTSKRYYEKHFNQNSLTKPISYMTYITDNAPWNSW